MADWLDTLYRELDEWNYAGVAATLWWRDDDAQAPSAALDHALDLAQQYAAPIALAVIPHGMTDALATRVNALPAVAVSVLQHGFAHRNHAPPDEKKTELGNHRPPSAVHRELATGLKALTAAFGERFVPALTPPWNRIAPALLDGLAPTGFTGLSTFAPRHAREAAPGTKLLAVNTHVDIVDWKRNKRFVGAQRAVDALVAHLSGRRLGDCDDAEPTGLLTHHLAHDAECWHFLERLLAALDEHPAAQWRSADVVFGGGGG